MATDKKIFCSLDIETSGFDPLTNEILEVGFAFFELGKKGLKITEEWTQVFNPAKPVPANILGLTGISQQELDEAPKFSEHQKFLQEKLGQITIVGHNVVFDIKFLEGFGLKFSGPVVDTLDMVQFILPTHHSYNLENLMHTFGISHEDAHRALADSKATIKLLEKLLQVYSGFSADLKTKIEKLLKPYDFAWKPLLLSEFSPLVFQEVLNKPRAKKTSGKFKTLPFVIQSERFYNFPLGQNYSELLAGAKGKAKILQVVPKSQTVLELFKQGKVDGAVFLPEEQFDAKKFQSLLNRDNHTPDEVKFLLKVLVWQHTNWQTETLLELNLSFFGGQFKTQISGGKIKDNKIGKVVVCSQETFLRLSEAKLFKNHLVLICGLNEFESAITSGIGTKTSWGYLNYLLKSFYNPELAVGQEKFRPAVETGLLAGDLFFGLVNVLLRQTSETFQYYRVSAETQYDEKYQKIRIAAESFTKKLDEVNKSLDSKEISKFCENLNEFFQVQDNRVKWVELAENRCAFLSMPLDISDLVKQILKPFAGVSFVDSLDADILPKFFLKRLGLDNYQTETVAVSAGTKTKSLQGDLFAGLKKVLGDKGGKIRYYCQSKSLEPGQLRNILESGKKLPAAVLLGTPTQVREFYDQNYKELKLYASLLAQSNSGGSNKIFRNFSIHKNSLLLATDKFILKHLKGQNAVEPVSLLPVKTLILCHIPFEQFTHPYQQAISERMENPFINYALPRALYNFQSVIKFFCTPELQEIYVIDQKLAKDYSQVFKDYYKAIPNACFVDK